MAQVSVTGSATQIVSAASPASPAYVVIRNHGATHVYLGSVSDGNGSGVTTSNGMILAAGDVYGLQLGEGDAVYGITAGTTITVGTMRLK